MQSQTQPQPDTQLPVQVQSVTPSFDAARQHFVDGNSYFEAAEYAMAQTSFEASLALMPGRVSTLSNLGATLLKLGQPGAALQKLDEALAYDAAALDALLHRGAALADLGRHDEALTCIEAALRLQPESVAAAYQRCLMLKQLGRFADVVTASDYMLAQDAGNTNAWWLRAEALHRLDQHSAALLAFDTLLTLSPELPRAWTQKAGLLKDMGRPADALAAFKQALALGGDPALNQYFIASLTGQQAPDAPPPGYVADLFDDYADNFNNHLVDVLNYRAPRVLTDHLLSLGKAHYRSALDLGCGTGLCGPLVRKRVNRLTGVDLSNQMLGKARALMAGPVPVYDELLAADIAAHLQSTDQLHDLVLSCDVFIYVGALDAVFAGVTRVLEPGGVFCFSVESTDDAHDFRLMPSQRYAHSQRYLQALAATHGLAVLKTEAQPIRQDQQQNIDGLYMFCVKPVKPIGPVKLLN